MKLLFVENPISGGTDKKTFMQESEAFCRKYGIEFELYKTTGKDDIEKLKKALKKFQPDRVVSIGGDGTTLMTSLAIRNSEIPFGIIPMGSANGMAKELKIPDDPMLAFTDLVVSQRIVPLDVIKVNDSHTMHLGDVGINANMVENYAKDEGRGWTAYGKHFLQAVKNATLFDVTLEFEGDTIERKVYSVVIANTRMFGTGVIINPGGNPHDGKFEIVLVTRHDLAGIINLGLTAFDQRALETLKDYVEIYTVETAKIKLDHPKILQLDGEVIGEVDTITTEILPACVRFISTGDNDFLD